MNEQIEKRSLADIRETFANLRIINPSSEAAMVESLKLYGQISPVVCVRTTDGLELLDGFKRLRAGHHLKWETIQTILFDTTVRACKAGIIRLNRIARSITDMEEAMVLQSLHRDDGLPMTEIATLVGHDKSWVSRRISLIERLADEVRRNVELGLISVSIGRALTVLPRGNQPDVLRAILKHRLGKREVEKLVRVLLSKPTWNWGAILNSVWELLAPEEPTPVTIQSDFSRQLNDLLSLQQTISTTAATLCGDQRPAASLLVNTIISARKVEQILEHLLAGEET